MDTVFWTQFLGVYFLVGSIGMFTNKGMIDGLLESSKKDAGFRMMSGMIALFFGLAIVLNHNIWTRLDVILVTLFGWIALLKGIFLIAFPPFFEKAAGWVKGKVTFFAAVWFILGLYLAYAGFLA